LTAHQVSFYSLAVGGEAGVVEGFLEGAAHHTGGKFEDLPPVHPNRHLIDVLAGGDHGRAADRDDDVLCAGAVGAEEDEEEEVVDLEALAGEEEDLEEEIMEEEEPEGEVVG